MAFESACLSMTCVPIWAASSSQSSRTGMAARATGGAGRGGAACGGLRTNEVALDKRVRTPDAARGTHRLHGLVPGHIKFWGTIVGLGNYLCVLSPHSLAAAAPTWIRVFLDSLAA
ncbi:hypothetical protein B0H17DRAFT_1151003 [Mycena rosella]|uniref:Uncharacterized protein n=1 Tax=Mycena rosella TaxID=1033263 RepID=A0AAD7BPP1_MYCRO|nr:hypothetical protein B0H17DRAFT_1151003 [Mycena rosella]